MKVKNVSGRNLIIADPEFPTIHVDADQVVDVPKGLADKLLDQPARWAKPTNSNKEG